MTCGEFDLITRYFNCSKNKRPDVQLGIGDDCALLAVTAEQWLAVSTDTLVSGIHFLPEIAPQDLAYKALAVNLSDLSAMGAEPCWLSLALTMPKVDEHWLKAFSDSLFEQLDYQGMQLIGGDTTRGPLSLTLTVHGHLPANKALTRAGAKSGDWIYVSGTLGDSAAGLAILQKKLAIDNAEDRKRLIERHLRPEARVSLGLALRGLANSAIDISDGLIADLQHILTASRCGAKIELGKLPYSDELQKYDDIEKKQGWALNGGEDYELCFTVPECNRVALEERLNHTEVNYSCIGSITSDIEKIHFFKKEQSVEIKAPYFNRYGFDHFAVTTVDDESK